MSALRKNDPIVIVGAGIFGLSTALHLARRGYDQVTVLDKQDYDQGLYSYARGCDAASADLNKIIRSAYGTQTEYQELSVEAIKLWNQWNLDLANGEVPPGMSPSDKVFFNNGAISFNDGDTLPPFEQATIEGAKKLGLATPLITNDPQDIEVARQLGFDTDQFRSKARGKAMVGILDTSGGYVATDKACRLALHKARRLGVKFIFGAQSGTFESLIRKGGRVVSVRTKDNQLHDANLTIMACGAHTPVLVPELDGLCEATAGSVAVFKIPKRGRYAAKACQECRRRRAKCDGQKPACSGCSGRQLQCVYTAEDDGRGMAPKAYVRQLQARIQILEEILRMHCVDIDASAAQLMQRNIVPQNSATDVSATAIDQLCDAVEGALVLDESMNFDRDGEARYFGTSSGRLAFRASDDAPGLSPREQSSPLADLYGTAFGDQIIVDQEVEAHLLDLYFIWDNPWFQVVDEALFRDNKSNKGRYYSPLLLHCILACGSRYSDRVEARSDPDDANTAGRPFLDTIEALLQDELKRPNITTIQSLAILSIVYFGSGQDAAGWLYSGMANRLVVDMGLHLDPDTLASSVRMTAEEAELRRQLYWALYCVDKTSAGYTGRVCAMLDFQGAVKLPEIPNHAEQSDPRHTLYSVSPNMSIALHISWIKLSQIMERVLSSLYAPKKLPTGDQRRNFFDLILLELKSWLYGLCTELKPIKGGVPNKFPQAYTLCMVYHTVVILLARPYIQRHRPSSPRQQQVDLLTQKALTIYLEAARSISCLGDQYRQVFGSFRKSPLVATYVNLSAALALLDSRHGHGLGEADDDRIKSCLQTLEELSTAWRPPAKYHCGLLKIIRDRVGSEQSKVSVSVPPTSQGNLCLDSQETGSNCTLSENHAGSGQVSGNTDWPLWELEENPDMPLVLEPGVGIQPGSDAIWENFAWNWSSMSFLEDFTDS